MALLNLRLSPDQQHRLETETRTRGISRSDVTCEALGLYFRNLDRRKDENEDIHDDWGDFGGKVIETHKQVLMTALEAIDDSEWAQVVEPLYAVFKEKTIDKSRYYQNPALFPKNMDAPFGAKVVAAIGFASDDVHEIAVDLEQLFFEYGWEAGDEALAESPRCGKEQRPDWMRANRSRAATTRLPRAPAGRSKRGPVPLRRI